MPNQTMIIRAPRARPNQKALQYEPGVWFQRRETAGSCINLTVGEAELLVAETPVDGLKLEGTLDNRILPILSQLPVTSMVLSGCELTIEFMQGLAALPQLINLDLSRCVVRQEMLEALAELPLVTLDLSGCTTTPGMIKSLARLRSLDNLILRNCRPTTAGAEEIAKLPLIRLDLSGSVLTAGRVKALSGLSVNELHLKFCKLTGEIVEALTGLTKLNSLNLSYCKLTPEMARALTKLSLLANLNLSNCQVRELFVCALAAVPDLTSLNLSGSKVTEGVAKALSAVKNLKSLDMTDCNPTPAIIRALASAPTLEVLNLRRCRITFELVRALRALSKLTSLTLSLGGTCESRPLSHPWVEALVALPITALELTRFKLTAALVAVLEQMPNLSSLDLLASSPSDRALRELAKLNKLVSLEFAFCSFADEEIELLKELFPRSVIFARAN